MMLVVLIKHKIEKNVIAFRIERDDIHFETILGC